MEKNINMITIAFGTRPELLKIEPLLKYWKSIGFDDFNIWLTGQHFELCLQLRDNWEFSKYVKTCYRIDDGENRLDDIVGTIILAHSIRALDRQKVSAILVQGDTASAYACALAAFHRKIPIIHLEAGLRSYDNENPYPEEFYRRSISMMSDINLCPTVQNSYNLIEEKAPGKNFIVGNTILDTIKDIIPTKTNTILCTLHRREILENIEEWFNNLDKLAELNKEYTFILPIHKNPDIYKYKNSFKYVKCIDPLNHTDFIKYLSSCAAIISDSGGVAEEGTWFKKPIFLCRKSTERPEGENFYIWIKKPEDLLKANISFYCNDNSFKNFYSPFGDGNSSKKITEILLKEGIIKK